MDPRGERAAVDEEMAVLQAEAPDRERFEARAAAVPPAGELGRSVLERILRGRDRADAAGQADDGRGPVAVAQGEPGGPL
ncbi:hypothetical protein ACFWUZ_12605 [Streptomyces sp. NPDC058646]|uniref:hypothetical protein n=1 Tax=Streptomyces sp. NPDC058646 TaxID=3346574 RepID=UPI003667714E